MPRRTPAPRRAALLAERLEDRVNPVSFDAGDWSSVGGNAMSIAIGEINGDGAIDMAVGTAENGVELFFNDGTGDFSPGDIITGMGFPEQMELADLTGDGFADIVTGLSFAQWVAVVPNNGDGTFGAPILKDIDVSVQDVDVGDFDSDGRLDVVAAIPGGAAVFFNDGTTGILGDATLYNHNSSAGGAWLTVGDFNGDASADFAVSVHLLRRVDVYLNDGAGQFTRTPYANPVANDSGDIICGDFTNDGHLDILDGYYLTGMLGLMVGNGDGTFQTADIIHTSASRVGPLAAADFDRDGNLDVLSMHGPDHDEFVLPGKGDGTFGTAVPVTTGFPGDIAVADVDTDGLPDIGTSQALSPGSFGLSINTTSVDLYFLVDAPATATAGDAFEVSVAARGPDGAILTDYTGTIHFAGTDAKADLPADYTFTAQDAGEHTFTVTFRSGGNRTLTITDPNSAPAYGADTLFVLAAEAKTFALEAPTEVDSEAPFDIALTARDEFENLAGGYDGTVHFTSTDPAATLPPDSTLRGGRGTFSVTLITAGDWTVTAADQAAGISTESAPITVNVPPPPPPPPPEPEPPIVADLGARGLRRWTESGGWEILSPLNAERIALSADGSTVVADFGTRGLRLWTEADEWVRLTPANVGKFAVSADGLVVVADFGAGGLKRWTEAGGWVKLSAARAQKVFLSANGAAIVADFGTLGLRQWNEGEGWTIATTDDPLRVAVSTDCSTIVASFKGKGLWSWTEVGGWVGLTAQMPKALAVSADGLTVIASFTENGLWSWTEAGGWVFLFQFTAERLSIAPDAETVLADFGKRGLRRWTESGGWTILTAGNVEDAILSPTASFVVADFGLAGLRLYETAWTKLIGGNPDQITTS